MLVVEIENYLNKHPDSTFIPDYYMQLGDLYTNVLRLPVKGLYFFQKVHTDFPDYDKAINIKVKNNPSKRFIIFLFYSS